MKYLQREKLKNPVWLDEGDTMCAEFYTGEERVGRLFQRSDKGRTITEIVAFELDGNDIEGVKWGFGGAFLEMDE